MALGCWKANEGVVAALKEFMPGTLARTEGKGFAKVVVIGMGLVVGCSLARDLP
jgi:uncharacterized protein (DUF697 family)